MVKNNPRITQFLNHLIDNNLLSSEAKKSKLDQSAQYKKMVEDAKRDILARLYVDQYIAEQSADKNLKSYFEKNKKSSAARKFALLTFFSKKKTRPLLRRS